MFLIVGGGEGSSNRNASRDESVEAGDKSVEAGDESIEAGEKTPQSCYNIWYVTFASTWTCVHSIPACPCLWSLATVCWWLRVRLQ